MSLVHFRAEPHFRGVTILASYSQQRGPCNKKYQYREVEAGKYYNWVWSNCAVLINVQVNAELWSCMPVELLSCMPVELLSCKPEDLLSCILVELLSCILVDLLSSIHMPNSWAAFLRYGTVVLSTCRSAELPTYLRYWSALQLWKFSCIPA